MEIADYPHHDLHFGPATKPTTLTVGTSHNQDRAYIDLLGWIRQQEEDTRTLYAEDIETLPSALLLEEIEEVFGGSRLVLAPPGYEPGQNRTTPTPPTPASSSPRRRRRRQLLQRPLLSSPRLQHSLLSHPRPQRPQPNHPLPQRVSCCLFLSAGTPPPSEPRPSSGPDIDFQLLQASLQSPAWVLSGLAAAQAAYFDSCYLDAALHLAKNPQDCASVLQVLQKEFPGVRLFDAPASSLRWRFTNLI
ncbi:hypothetical protein CRENBAI_002263 [Crenichthys baileyi]|uniref:Uncharacterized protein n=1 Tax=Crenichthys baileyi TaxID=28760 RepID=A0AAV9SG06_9TELE